MQGDCLKLNGGEGGILTLAYSLSYHAFSNMHENRMNIGAFYDLAFFNCLAYFGCLGPISHQNRHQRHQAAVRFVLGGRRNPTMTLQQKMNHHMVLAKSTANRMQRFAPLPTMPYLNSLHRRKRCTLSWNHEHHLLEKTIYTRWCWIDRLSRHRLSGIRAQVRSLSRMLFATPFAGSQVCLCHFQSSRGRSVLFTWKGEYRMRKCRQIK